MKKILFLLCILSVISYGEIEGIVESGERTGEAKVPVNVRINILPEEVSFKILDSNYQDITEINFDHGDIINGTTLEDIATKSLTQNLKVVQETAGNYSNGNIKFAFDDDVEGMTFVDGGHLKATLTTDKEKTTISKDNEAEFSITSTLSNEAEGRELEEIHEEAGEYSIPTKNLVVTYEKLGEF